MGFGLMVALIVLILGKAIYHGNTMADLNQRFATNDLPRLLRVQSLSLQTEGVGIALIRLMNAPRDSRVMAYADVDARNHRIDDIIKLLGADLMDPLQDATLQRLIAYRAVYADAFIATADEIEGDNLPEAKRLLNDRVNPALKDMLTESNALIQRERERIESQVEQTQVWFDQVVLWGTALGGLSVVLAIWLGFGTARSVVKPLAQLELAAQRIALGDYTSRVPPSSAQEIDRVAQALNTMTDAVAMHERELRHQAFHDPLTGLPNRTFLLQTGAVQPDLPACNSLLLFDLSRLKTINETLGFSAGDTLIQELARRATAVLAQATGPESAEIFTSKPLLAHVAGGMFAIVFNENERARVDHLRARLADAMAQPVLCNGHQVDLALAFGLADSPTDAPAPVITLLRNAEVALDTAKQAAQGFAWYNPAQEAARLSHLGLLSDLRVAVAQSQLQMWLQPKFSLRTGQAVGAEALVRWQHPQRGMISPAEFVPFAEQTGAISQVTDWMLAQAMATLQVWQTTQPELSLSVNVSTRDLQDPLFCQRVKQRMQQHQIEPHRLRLEIVESGLMHDASASIALLHRLRVLGVQLSIDDFGTGYSSLAYLQKLPVSELKIDRSFIINIDAQPLSQKLVKTMIDLGHSMDLSVTAEGIETEAERDTLKRLGCDVMQGYFGSRPLHGPALQAWFDALEPVTS